MKRKARINRQKRREAERNAMLNTPYNHKEVARLKYKCREMRKNGADVHLDHIVPIRAKLACGLTCPANLQIITANQDRKKGNEFVPYRIKNGIKEQI